jgi:hypothetical protein
MHGEVVLVALKKTLPRSSFSTIMNVSEPSTNAKVSGTAIRSILTYYVIVNATNLIRTRDVTCGKLS